MLRIEYVSVILTGSRVCVLAQRQTAGKPKQLKHNCLQCVAYGGKITQMDKD